MLQFKESIFCELFNTEIQFFNYVTLNIFVTSRIRVSSFYLVFAS